MNFDVHIHAVILLLIIRYKVSCRKTQVLRYMFVHVPMPILVAARSKAWVCGRSLAGIAGSNPAGAWISVCCVVCCRAEVSATGRSLVQRSPTECGVSECDQVQQ